MTKCQFASDNTAGICPEAWEAMNEAGQGHALSYGDDPWTDRATKLFRRIFDTECEVYFVFNGTAANSLALASMCQSYHSIIAHESAHVETDECGAPEFYSNGTKLLLAGGDDGKLTPQTVEPLITKRKDIHFPKPRVVSVTLPTEFGTLYRADEIQAISTVVKSHGMHLHMDGARFANAVAAMDVAPKTLTWQAGVDVLCLGGTKAGIGLSEAVVFFNHDLAKEFDYRCKQAGQLASKMRFMSSAWLRMLEDDLWLKYARHANAMARQLAQRLSELPGVKVVRAVEANAVFLQLTEVQQARLRERGWRYYTFIGGGARFMCSWQTSQSDVDELLRDLTS